jgi:hypothetical protein
MRRRGANGPGFDEAGDFIFLLLLQHRHLSLQFLLGQLPEVVGFLVRELHFPREQGFDFIQLPRVFFLLLLDRFVCLHVDVFQLLLVVGFQRRQLPFIPATKGGGGCPRGR